MVHKFDPGYTKPVFRALCENYPDTAVYPQADFRTEWGPIFHRGRLNGTARVLVIGQDPAAHEGIARRVLVGVAGQRVQGFLKKLGMTKRYVIINAFLYSYYSPRAGNVHKDDAALVAYRHQWIDALMAPGKIQAVIAFGTPADYAWNKWKATPTGMASAVAYSHIKHPTWPESSADGDPAALATATGQMLTEWNAAITVLRPAIPIKDISDPFVPYGATWDPADTPPIPDFDLPAGLPEWMRGGQTWAARVGATPAIKRATIEVTVPPAYLPP